MKIIKYLGIFLGFLILLILVSGAYIRLFKPDMEKPTNLKIERTAARVERGKYLANHVTVCIDCHSRRDWSLFSGPVVKGSEGSGGEKFDRKAGFPGTIYATNLTPYQLSSWTDGEIYRAISGGVGKNGRALFPLMGYHRFGKMDREDIFSIIVYLRTLSSIANDVPDAVLDFPVSLLNRLSPQKPMHQKIPAPGDSVKYGGYIVNAAGCVECHSKQDKGKIVPGTEFAGGMEFRQPVGIIRAPNITMDPQTGIGNWDRELFVAKFKAYADTSHRLPPVPKGELNSPMPWGMYAGMKRQDIEAIYTYLKSIKPKVSSIKVRSYNND
ncbi:Cytochrome c [bacterium A37T11]|nr:Cytochrome c [bacterium A37T11]